jgi:Uncharacterized paraquat-inducible protein A
MSRRFPRLRSERLANPAAFAMAAAAMLVPANVLPILTTRTMGQVRTDTIFSGTVELWRQEFWAIAAIVFIASIVIPVLKLAGLGWLLVAARRGNVRDPRRLTRLYEVLDFIGRWSMLDVFLVAFLAGLVRFGVFSNIEPGQGIAAFALAVVLTALATHAFDPRVLWRGQAMEAAR